VPGVACCVRRIDYDRHLMTVRAAILDMDGTLLDTRMDWIAIRREIGLPADGRPILEQLATADPVISDRGRRILAAAERSGVENGSLMPGATELVEHLRSHGVACVLITNNTRACAEIVLKRHPLSFDIVMTRDDGVAKPSPDMLWTALGRLGVEPQESVAVGDAHLDVIAAHRAGIAEIIAVGLAEWMKPHIPKCIAYEEAADLDAVRRIIAARLDGRKDS